MKKKDPQFQDSVLSRICRNTGIFKPLHTGRIDEHVRCVREKNVNLFFYTKNGTTLMIDAGYRHGRLKEKMRWLDIDPAEIRCILLTHQDMDHIGGLEADSDGLFRKADVYLSEIEDSYLRGRARRRALYGHYALPQAKIENRKVLFQDKEVLELAGIRVECLLAPGHTWGHTAYLIDDRYLFTGDALWLGPDGGTSFLSAMAEDNELAKRSLVRLKTILQERGLRPEIITSHSGWSDDPDFAFAHIERACSSFRKQKPHDPAAPADGYDEKDDTEENARHRLLEPQKRIMEPGDCI